MLIEIPDGARAILESDALAHLVTTNPPVKFPPMDDAPPGWVARIGIERLSGVGPWA